MNSKFLKKLSILSTILISSSALIGAFPKADSNSYIFKKNKDVIILDSDLKTPLPNRFRDVTLLNISGSAQFTNDQVEPLKKAINKENICIVDLRQESHGLLNDLAISYHNFYKLINNGFDSVETIEKENSELNKIKTNSQVNIFHENG